VRLLLEKGADVAAKEKGRDGASQKEEPLNISPHGSSKGDLTYFLSFFFFLLCAQSLKLLLPNKY